MIKFGFSGLIVNLGDSVFMGVFRIFGNLKKFGQIFVFDVFKIDC